MENNPTTPASENGALDVSTPEGAKTRISDLLHDRAFAERYNSGDKIAKAELDQLQRTAYLGEPPPPTNQPLTPELAKAKIELLTGSREWGARYLANPQGPEGRELERLERVASGLPETPPPPRPPREPGVPETASSYMFAEPIPQGSEELAQSFQAAAHGVQLTSAEFTQVHQQALRDEKANAGRSEAEIVDQLDRDLHQIWGKDYERRGELLERYVNDYERAHPGTRAFINANGLQYNKALIVTLALKALQKYGNG